MVALHVVAWHAAADGHNDLAIKSFMISLVPP